MKKVKKPVFFIVLGIILLFAYSVYAGFATQYGDIKTTHIKGLHDIRLGIDIRGGVDVSFSPDSGIDATDAELDSAMEVIKLRLSKLNISDYESYVDYKKDNLIVRFPWKADEKDFDPERAVKELGETASLRFIEGTEITGDVVLSGADVVSALSIPQRDENGTLINVVSLKLTEEGKTKFGEATTRLYPTRGIISIWMDDTSISSATVNEAITNGEAVISGNFSSTEAKALADKINSGALPFKLETTSFKTISPTMGEGALDSMVLGGIIAFCLIAIFMFATYKLPGFISIITLLGQVAGTLAIVSGYFGFMPSSTLTIPGIAGIILSIGMGVDANVITAERIKEEINTGKPLDNALKLGYDRAFTSIFDGNITVIIVAAVLMGAFGTPDSFFAKMLNIVFKYFGVSTNSTIYSFGFTLLAGVILNFIMGVLASRLMLFSLSKFKAFRNPKLYGGADSE
ncbi:MAG: SecD/SecF family protein translocase subunit [Clostridiales bacterium]|nr:SecD/SecF family protein translocase subunit [Clostridiales bacterium]